MIENSDNRVQAMREALISCARVFRWYEEIHNGKSDVEKAKRNREMAELCDRALGQPQQPERGAEGKPIDLWDDAGVRFCGDQILGPGEEP